ncbi:phosphoserine phosphatase serb [Rozella allomycis CSF55]|uniref:O-phosphoserine phosphohydrolase n=1 Tax=Rozella allomycis (strain CSF55) TaxID=988480 RepID=A0A4P9YNV4_ROZAC|nr:phosphoserine phosphatase serb [Rozella allomycis CSF55]
MGIFKIRLIVFDLDSTLINQECIDEMAKIAGLNEEIAKVTNDAMNGLIDFSQSIKLRIEKFKGCDEDLFDRVKEIITLRNGCKELFMKLNEDGVITVIASGSFLPLVEFVSKELGCDYYFGNQCEILKGKFTGDIRSPILDASAKAGILWKLCKQHNISLDLACAVGDGANDIEMIKMAGIGIAFNAKPIVQSLNLMDFECNKLLISKALGIGIILGSSIVKIPQILTIVNSLSVDGLSLLSYSLESWCSVISSVYNIKNGYPFSTYGESVFISVQNLVIVALIFLIRKKVKSFLVFSILFLWFSYQCLYLAKPGDLNLGYLQQATIPIIVLSRIPQIYSIYKNKSTGKLSAITIFLMFGGSMARIFTTLTEVNDLIVLCSFILGAATNSILAFQMIYYWNSKKKISDQKKKQ